jgi:branched-subunit amino acid transport protein
VSIARLAALIGVMTAAVVLPKAAPQALLSSRLHPLADGYLRLVPAGLLGGLVVISVAGAGGTHVRAVVAVAVAVAATVAVLTRRSLLAMACGWATLAAGLALPG